MIGSVKMTDEMLELFWNCIPEIRTNFDISTTRNFNNLFPESLGMPENFGHDNFCNLTIVSYFRSESTVPTDPEDIAMTKALYFFDNNRAKS